jgi:fructose-bisphosphate aldolase class I
MKGLNRLKNISNVSMTCARHSFNQHSLIALIEGALHMTERLEDIAIALVAAGKGILAADESSGTIKKRFDAIDLGSTEDTRRDYREMLFRADEAMKNYISGVILYDETIRQKAKDGTPLVEIIRNAGAVPGIKVDAGAKPLAGFEGETITEGLDGLRERLNEYHGLGARFAKWRAVISISDGLPTWGAVKQNAQALARYAALCQEANIVPIVEPEVLMDGKPGNHTIDRCYDVTEWVLKTVFTELYDARVRLEGMILKPNMVIDGKNARKASVEEVAEKTVRCFRNSVPAAVPGIAFLSGGQTGEEATAHLSAMNAGFDMPWKMTFSYGRALQAAALEAWGGRDENIAAGQRAFAHRAKMNGLAATGGWKKELEKAA